MGHYAEGIFLNQHSEIYYLDAYVFITYTKTVRASMFSFSRNRISVSIGFYHHYSGHYAENRIFELIFRNPLSGYQ